nr:unnamed protein product [Callosobruchus chinensis]
MHQAYKEWCAEKELDCVERKLFNAVLKQEKISIFNPRKDQCDICVGYNTGNISHEEYELHIMKKDEARTAKKQATSMCSEKILVITMDVQSVLLCRKLLVSKQYYKQKLQLHNFTIYINNNKDVHCYVWHESDGNVTSNEFTTCLIDFLAKFTDREKIVIISDGCCYQNKNKVLVL